jgi:Tol biopolymer transport system component
VSAQRRVCIVVTGLVLTLAVSLPNAGASTATTRRASVKNSGAEAPNGALYPSISGDGRFVAFDTNSALVPSDTNGETDIYVRDLRAGTTRLVSMRSNGALGNGDSGYAAISANGRFVTFSSEASNLVKGDTNGLQDVFVHDRSTGTTTRVSVSTTGRQGNDDSNDQAISANGRFVTFESDATNLVRDDANGYGDVFVHDRETARTTLVSVSSSGEQANASAGGLAPGMISADGSRIVFASEATNLVPGDTNSAQDVFVHDRGSGTTRRVSVNSQGVQGDDRSSLGSISGNGRFVAFSSPATNLVGNDANAETDIFVRDLVTKKTTRVSVGSAGTEASGSSSSPSISATGRYVAFDSIADDLIGDDTNGSQDIFVRDRESGKTRRVSLSRGGDEGDSNSDYPLFSADGRFVAFQSLATNLIGSDTNAATDIYVRGPLT